MSKYKSWLSRQEKEFIFEVCGKYNIPEFFRDYNFKPISLDELKILDDKYILNVAGPQQ